jgi:hypothetical protein
MMLYDKGFDCICLLPVGTQISVVISGSVAVAMQPTQIQNNPEEEFLVSLKPWPGHFQILRFSLSLSKSLVRLQ